MSTRSAPRIGSPATSAIRYNDNQTFVLPGRRLSGHGLEAWEQVVTQGYEGLVARDPASSYVGERTLQWPKVKQPECRAGERGWEPTR